MGLAEKIVEIVSGLLISMPIEVGGPYESMPPVTVGEIMAELGLYEKEAAVKKAPEVASLYVKELVA